ncbi:MAG TPA: TetR family transcriptional regulator [Ktedonobacterales bacterium]|nr:TetR family transcriptional regulator [Ktedonobacterales bacterium]
MQRALQRVGRERDAEAAREAILNAAETIFARDGFSGARVDDIAQSAGYNKALIFHYFDDKLGLYRALMSRTKERVFAQLNAAFDRFFGNGDEAGASEGAVRVSAGRIRDFAAACMQVTFGYYQEHPEAARMLAWEAAEGWQTYVSCLPQTPSSWASRVMALFQQAQAAGIVRADLDPQLLFLTVMSLPLIHMISLPRYALVFPEADFASSEALSYAREQLTELVLRGTLAHPEEE